MDFDNYLSSGKQSIVLSVCLFHFRSYELCRDHGVEYSFDVSFQGVKK